MSLRMNLSKKLKLFYCRYIPHKTKSGDCWCRPVWFAYFFGGNFDTGNGYGWTPSLIRRIKRYYREGWYDSYSLFDWLKIMPTSLKKKFLKKR